MKKILLSKKGTLNKGKYALVDDEDYEHLSQWDWSYNKRNAVRNPWVSSEKKQIKVYMHREIMKTPDDMDTDHINGDGLDNRRANLRICTTRQNTRNRKIGTNNTSQYKGVSWYGPSSKWKSQINISGTNKLIGFFEDPKEAAKAYDEAARKHHGEFANINNV